MIAIKLNKIDTRPPKTFDKEKTKAELPAIYSELDGLQNVLYAQNKYAVLIVVQGMDASGKDGLIKHVFTSMNPQGVSVQSYKAPATEELSHDFLWRIHKHVPAKGMMQVFNRSHYEDILVTRVHKMINDDTAYKRMKAINDFEELLTVHNNTIILKFYLHVSAQKQQERLNERVNDITKQWKYNKQDVIESSLRKKYIKAYEDCFKHCNKIKWTIVPADQNWYKEYVVATTLRDELKKLNMQYPALKK